MKEPSAPRPKSDRHPSAKSMNSQKSLPQMSSRPVNSIDSADSAGTRTPTKFPPINSFRRLSKLASCADAIKPKDRRISHPFPVTSWEAVHGEEEERISPALRRLRNTKSHANLHRSSPEVSGNEHVWGMTLALSQAKRKMSQAGEKALLKRRISLKDFLNVAAMKRPDGDKRKMIRELKRKALMQKKALLAKFKLAGKLAIFCARNFKQHCLSLAGIKQKRTDIENTRDEATPVADELDEFIGLRTPQPIVNVDNEVGEVADDALDAAKDDKTRSIQLDVENKDKTVARERNSSLDFDDANGKVFVNRSEDGHGRINEHQDELAPFIKRLHFHEDDSTDLLIDLSKFKANRQLRIPDETKRILSKEVGQRTDQEIYSVTVALRNIKSYAEYPNRMQKKIAEVGLYEKYESKRVIVRQNHPATAFYFILSGAVVVMVMDEDTKYARPVAHLYKGQTFGELAIINGSKRNSTVIAKETCEFLSISVQDYHKIFMAGGIKNISDPDQEIFLKSLKCLANWPIQLLPQHPTKCQFLFFKNSDVIIRDSSISEWIIIVKSGSIQVLKKLKKVEAFAWKKKKNESVVLADPRDVSLKQTVFRRILPEIKIPLNPDMEEEELQVLTNGRPRPFRHPGDRDDAESVTSSQRTPSRVPNLWPFNVDLSQMESGRYLEDEYRFGATRRYRQNEDKTNTAGKGNSSERFVVRKQNRSASIINEEEKELGGFQPHIRTIQEDLNPGATNNKTTTTDETTDLNPEFVLVHTLTKGQVFGLSDVIIGEQPSFSVVSKGADCILINKHFYMDNASEKLLNEMRQGLCPYPTEDQLQQSLQDSVDWHAFRKTMLLKSLNTVSVRRHMRTTIQGTKVQEAF